MKTAITMTTALSLTGMFLFGGCGSHPVAVESEQADAQAMPAEVSSSYAAPVMKSYAQSTAAAAASKRMAYPASAAMPAKQEAFNTERYSHTEENDYKNTAASPLSTLSIDVDTASYTNVVRMIEDEDRLPPSGAVRIEEMINYFSYDYPQPAATAEHPFTITTEVAPAPWDSTHRLMLVGLQAKQIPAEQLPPSNFVALVDVSGSMESDLPLVKQSLKLLAKKLRRTDRLSIVNYATNIGLTLEPTAGDRYEVIEKAIDSLASYGGTNGEAGIEVAYEMARQTFMPKGNNRVLMFTDGDFNVGRTSESEMVRIVEKERESGVFLSIVGFGWGNTNDATMEQMADHGNGNYSYVNDLLDAKKVFDSEMTGTLYTLGKDVKFQLEFNPAVVGAYRLIGYENRLLAAEDFNDDTKDAGEIGVGHSVTALYELIPAGMEGNATAGVDPLKYQRSQSGTDSAEIATVKMRYKAPEGETSKLMVAPVSNALHHSDNLTFASAVAGYGMLLSDSKYKGAISYADVIAQAKAAKGKDDAGYRAAFIRLVEKTALLEQ